MTKQWIALLAAGAVSLVAYAQQPAPLVLEGAWVRALPPTQSTTAAYLSVRNTGDVPVIITGGQADLATTVEIHTTREIDGYHRMEQLPKLTVAPGEQVDLSPGGIHLMLLGLQRMPAAGERTRLCLTLESGDKTCTEAAVRKSAREQDNHDHHQHH